MEGSLSTNGGICTVFSTDCSAYLGWQSLLLAWTHARIAQPGSLLRLVAGGSRPLPYASACATFGASQPDVGDDYPCYNRPHSIAEWMRAGGPREELVLLADPDFVFLRPLRATAQRGTPLAQRIGYMDPAPHFELIRRHCSVPEALQPVGWPVLIHRDDLARIAEPWCSRLRAIRRHPRSREEAGWIADMWAYCFVAAEAGLEHEPTELAAFEHQDRDDLPIVHYCYSAREPGGWHFDKRTYRPWSRVPAPPSGTPRAAQALTSQLNELITELQKDSLADLLAKLSSSFVPPGFGPTPREPSE